MRALSLLWVVGGALVISLAGCGSEGDTAEEAQAYDDSWGSDPVNGGKADSFFDEAKPLTFTSPVEGDVGQNSLALFYIDLKKGDKFELVMTVKSGDLNPHLSLYEGLSTRISSDSYKRVDGPPVALIKQYTAPEAGRFYIAARAYQDKGTGHFALSAACKGGPCAGQPVVEPLSVEDEAYCIMKARRCAFEGMKQYNGAVGAARARSLFEGCLKKGQTETGGACSPACSAEDEKALCDDIIAAIPVYAKKTDACLDKLGSCMAECYEAGGNGSAEEFWKTAESICWSTGYNGNCNTYSQGNSVCGGTDYKDGSHAECLEYCETTFGAWNDDLDTVCEETCQDIPE